MQESSEINSELPQYQHEICSLAKPETIEISSNLTQSGKGLSQNWADIICRIVNESPENWDSIIVQALVAVSECSRANSVCLLQYGDDKSRLLCSHSTDVSRINETSASICAQELSSLLQSLDNGSFIIEDPQRYNKLWPQEFRNNKLLSGILLPLKTLHGEIGVLVLGFPVREPDTATIIQNLSFITRVLATLVERKAVLASQHQSELELRALLEDTMSQTAEGFFRSLTRHLAGAYSVDYSYIATLRDAPEGWVQALAFWQQGEFCRNQKFIISGSPIEKVINEGAPQHCCNAHIAFPTESFFKRERIESFLGVPLKTSDGAIIGIMVLMHGAEIKERADARWCLEICAARAAAELERVIADDDSLRLHRQLMQAQKMEAICQLASGVAHDLNNALFTVSGYLQLIGMNEPSSAQFDKNVHKAVEGCERASALIGQLLSFSRQGKYNIRPIKLSELVDNAINYLITLVGQKVKLIHKKPTQDLVIQGDHAQIQQALTNIIVNAKQAMPKSGRIRISYSEQFVSNPHRFNIQAQRGNYICLTIADNGPGISERDLERIFEPFFTTKEIGRGSGLGLAMVYGIMQNHGGWVEAKSIVGEGSAFNLYFPRSMSDMESATKSEATPIARVEKQILVIDDEDVLVELLRTFLERAGYKTVGFSSSLDAINWYSENSDNVDLVLLDMKMPEMSGPECFERLRRIKPQTRVIILSGYIQDESAQKLLKQGALQFLQKPIRYDQLVRLIQSHLQGTTLELQ